MMLAYCVGMARGWHRAVSDCTGAGSRDLVMAGQRFRWKNAPADPRDEHRQPAVGTGVS
jgi:hypothetical protein